MSRPTRPRAMPCGRAGFDRTSTRTSRFAPASTPQKNAPGNSGRVFFARCENEKFSFEAGKPDSVLPRLRRVRPSFLSRLQAGRALRCPLARARESAAYPWLLDGPPSHLFCLAPEGVFHAADVTVDAVGSYPTVSPLPEASRLATNRSGRFIFCDTIRRRALKRIARAGREACAASCPMVSGLSSPNFYRARHYPRLGIKELGATIRPQS